MMQKRQETPFPACSRTPVPGRLFPSFLLKTVKTVQKLGRKQGGRPVKREQGAGPRAAYSLLSCQNCINPLKSLLFVKNVTVPRDFNGEKGPGAGVLPNSETGLRGPRGPRLKVRTWYICLPLASLRYTGGIYTPLCTPERYPGGYILLLYTPERYPGGYIPLFSHLRGTRVVYILLFSHLRGTRVVYTPLLHT